MKFRRDEDLVALVELELEKPALTWHDLVTAYRREFGAGNGIKWDVGDILYGLEEVAKTGNERALSLIKGRPGRPNA